MKRNLAVKFTYICGSDDFSAQTIVLVGEKETAEKAVDNHFKNLYGVHLTDSVRLDLYMYKNGTVGVKDISWTEITEEEKNFLNKIGIY